MPEIFKPTYRDKKTGATKTSESWFARIGGRRVPLRTKDRRIAERKAIEAERIAELGYDPTALDRHRKRPILEHLVAFEDALKAGGVGHGHLQNLRPRIEKIIAGCGIRTLADIDAGKVESWLASQQDNGGMSVGTRKHYASGAKQFGRWLVETDRASRSPFAGLRTDLNVDAHRVYSRRALSFDDCQKFLASVRASTRRAKLSGEDRYFMYRIALATGLRRNEIGSLVRGSFPSLHERMVVTLPGRCTKNRELAFLPVCDDLAAELRVWMADRPHGELLLPIRGRRMGYVIQADLKDAGIPHEVEGRVIDFHSLRGTFITHLGLAGVPLVVAQKLARHSTPVLTANAYTHLGLGDLASAVAKLPALGSPRPEPNQGKQ